MVGIQARRSISPITRSGSFAASPSSATRTSSSSSSTRQASCRPSPARSARPSPSTTRRTCRGLQTPCSPVYTPHAPRSTARSGTTSTHRPTSAPPTCRASRCRFSSSSLSRRPGHRPVERRGVAGSGAGPRSGVAAGRRPRADARSPARDGPLLRRLSPPHLRALLGSSAVSEVRRMDLRRKRMDDALRNPVSPGSTS